MAQNKAKKKVAKIEIVKKICPLNSDLDCPDCRLYEMTDRQIMRCVFNAILDDLDFIKLNIDGE